MVWSDDRAAYVRALCAALLEFGRAVFTRGTVTDVVAWSRPDERSNYSALYVAFVGDGLKVAREFGYLTPPGADVDLGVQGSRLAYGFQRYLHAENAYLSTRHDRKVALSDFLDRVGGQAAGEFAEHSFDEVQARFIIEPGYPWPENDAPGLVYWSAKQKKMIRPERPGWLIDVPDRDEPMKRQLGVNPCAVFPPEERDQDWPLWGQGGKTDVIVAHSMSLLNQPDEPVFPFLGTKSYKQIDTAAESIRACGGMLFPSLSVGPIPASNFGPITLVGHLGLVLDGLKPVGEKWSDSTSWVYEHDAWTVGTSDLMREVAVRLFDEFHGAGDYIYGYNIWALGPPAEVYGGPSEGSSALQTFGQLLSAIKKRSHVFKRGLSADEFDTANEKVAGTVDKYAYCEAKARRVIALKEFPFMVAPDSLREKVERFAAAIEYPGEIVYIEDSIGIAENDMSESRDYLYFQWAWIVADQIKRLAAPAKLPAR